MSRGLGVVQRRILDALRQCGGEADLRDLAWYAAGLIGDPTARLRSSAILPRGKYVPVARAVASLRKRGWIATKMLGTRKDRIVWIGPRPTHRFSNPSRFLVVRLSDDISLRKGGDDHEPGLA